MSSDSNTPPDGYFNDLSVRTGGESTNKRRRTPNEEDGAERPEGDLGGVPKPKRIACVICRKRKLKCDGSKPSCSTCTRLGHNCAYDEVRRKSGPKRGYVKALEERLKQVETLLKTQDPADKSPDVARTGFSLNPGHNNTNANAILQAANADFDVSNPSIAIASDRDADRWHFAGDSPQPTLDDMTFNAGMNIGLTMDEATFTWEMIGLGLDEPLPPQETIDELHQIYFEKIHPSVPMIHKFRYLAAMNLAPNQRPPVALRYAMWTLACSVTERYADLKQHFYQRARKYVEQDYLKGHGEHMISVSHAQTHILLASYEFKMMYFPRAWMSTGSASRLSQMMGLHRLDGTGLDVKQCLPPPRDWTEREERRRTFWMAFCQDRYASIGTGWPMTFDEKDISTTLPATEDAFEKSKPEQTSTLAESFCSSGASSLSAFAGIVLMAGLFGRNLIHLHRPESDDRDGDLNGEFWKRHRNMDNILLNISLSLPSHLKLPDGLGNPNIVFLNMNIHTSTICLHQAAIYKAEKNRLSAIVSKESKLRCITAANEIASIMRMISHMDLVSMNPFISFCLYVSARVFVQFLKSRPDDTGTSDSLRFLLSAMNAMKARNPLTESFLVQLDVDLESLRLRNPQQKPFTQGYASGAKSSGPPSGLTNGPDGRIDQCNFLKIIDHSEPMEGGQTCEHTNSSNEGIKNNPEVDNSQYKADFVPLDWLPVGGIPTREGVHAAGMQGLILGQGPGTPFEQGGFQGHVSGYGPSDMELSDAAPSDRPTPNSSTPSDGRVNLQPGHSQAGHSSRSSFETSPVSSHQHNLPNDGGGNPAFFGSTPGYTGMGAPLGPNGLTSGNAPFAHGWEMSDQGLTPVGEGVFREMMGMGPMEMGWDGTS